MKLFPGHQKILNHIADLAKKGEPWCAASFANQAGLTERVVQYYISELHRARFLERVGVGLRGRAIRHVGSGKVTAPVDQPQVNTAFLDAKILALLNVAANQGSAAPSNLMLSQIFKLTEYPCQQSVLRLQKVGKIKILGKGGFRQIEIVRTGKMTAMRSNDQSQRSALRSTEREVVNRAVAHIAVCAYCGAPDGSPNDQPDIQRPDHSRCGKPAMFQTIPAAARRFTVPIEPYRVGTRA